MFHLFDKVYIMYDTNVGLNAGGIIISPNKSIYFDATVTDSEDYDQRFHYNVDSYEELVGSDKEFEDDEEFFKYLSSKIHINRSRHKIYCDETNMIKIFIKYMKMLFPNISARAVYMWYKLYFHKIKMHFGYTDSTIFHHKDFWIEKMWFEFQQKELFDFDAFCKLFANTEFTGDATSLRETLADRVEFSFAVARYLTNKINDENYTDESIETKIKYMYFRTLDDELGRVKMDVVHGVYSLNDLYPNVQCNFDMSPNEIITQVPDLTFVLDEKIGSSFWYWDHYDTYEIDKLINAVENYWSRRNNTFGKSKDPWCPIGIFELLRNKDYTALDVLKFLSDNRFFSEIVLTRQKSLKFNYFFLSYLLEAWEKGDFETLNAYSI